MQRRPFALFLACLIALMPMSVLAGFCPAPAEQQEMPCHEQAPVQPDSCADMQSCCGGCPVSAIAITPALPNAPERAQPGAAFFAGFVPDQLDPPPVVL